MGQATVSVLDEKFNIKFYSQNDIGYHSHSFFELVYILEGSAVHELDNGDNWEVHAGDYFIIDYGTRHRYVECKNCLLINCLFLPEMIHDTLSDCRCFDEILKYCLLRYYRQLLGKTPVNHIFHDSDGRIRAILSRIQDEYDARQLGYEELFRCGVIEVVICMVRRFVEESNMSVQEKDYSEPVRRLLYYLSAAYQEKGLLSEYCRKNHYSIPYLSRCFKEETGYTVPKYLQKLRVEKSCELLLSTDMQIQQIAHEVGYEDTKSYQLLFRQLLGMSPREYRKKYLGQR